MFLKPAGAQCALQGRQYPPDKIYFGVYLPAILTNIKALRWQPQYIRKKLKKDGK
jgi:hypothetical protein